MIFMVLGICGLAWILKKWWYKSGGVLVEKQGQDKKKVVVFGASESGRKAVARLCCFGVAVKYFTDNDARKWGSCLEDIKIIPPEEIFHQKERYTVIISSVYEKEIMRQCLDAGMEESQVYILEDYIIQIAENFICRYQYLKNAGFKPGSKTKLIIMVPDTKGTSGVISLMHAIGKGLSRSGFPYIMLADGVREDTPEEMLADMVLYNSYPDKFKTDKGMFHILPEEYTKFFWRETDSLLYILARNMPCTIITNETYGEQYIAAYMLKKIFPEYVKVTSIIHSDERARYLRGIWHEKDLDGYIAGIPHIVQVFNDVYKVSKDKLFYHEMPVDVPEIMHKYSKEDEPLVIGYLGRIEVKSKRCDLLPQLIEELEGRDINYILRIAGTGSYLEELRLYVLTHGLSEKVKLEGYVSHDSIAEFWNTIDTSILLSENEGNALAMIESMFCGCVPVTTDLEYARCISNGENGYIVPQEGCKEMAGHIEFLAGHKNMLLGMGKKAKETVKEEHSIGRYTEFLLDMHKKVWE